MYPDHGSIEQLQMPNRNSSSNNNNNNNDDRTPTNSGKRRSIFNVFKNSVDTKIHYKFMKKEK